MVAPNETSRGEWGIQGPLGGRREAPPQRKGKTEIRVLVSGEKFPTVLQRLAGPHPCDSNRSSHRHRNMLEAHQRPETQAGVLKGCSLQSDMKTREERTSGNRSRWGKGDFEDPIIILLSLHSPSRLWTTVGGERKPASPSSYWLSPSPRGQGAAPASLVTSTY